MVFNFLHLWSILLNAFGYLIENKFDMLNLLSQIALGQYYDKKITL